MFLLFNLSNSIISKGKILSQPHPENGSILVDANEFFLRDIGYVSQHGKGRYSFDLKNSEGDWENPNPGGFRIKTDDLPWPNMSPGVFIEENQNKIGKI